MKYFICACALALLISLFATASRAQAQVPFPAANLRAAAAYSADAGGSAVLVVVGDSVVFEDYHNGADANTAPHIYSGTKAFWAVAAAAAKQAGLLDYAAPVAETITEWQDPRRHPGKRRITVEHLLRLTSGLSQDTSRIQGPEPAAADLYAYAVDSLGQRAAPGTAFSYGPSNYYVFGELLRRKLEAGGFRQNPLQFLDSAILQPIGLEYERWLHDDAGNAHLPNGCHLRPGEWAKFGRLLRDHGRWEGRQIVDSALVAELFFGGEINPGHGRFVWLNRMNGYGILPAQSAPDGSAGGFMYHGGHPDLVGALGAGKNRMYVLPSLDAVVVRQTTREEDDYRDHTFLSALLAGVTSALAPALPQARQVVAYPNPFTDVLTLQPEASQTDIRLYDATGRLVHRAEAGPGPVHLSLASLPVGAYTLEVFDLATGVSQRSLVVKH